MRVTTMPAVDGDGGRLIANHFRRMALLALIWLTALLACVSSPANAAVSESPTNLHAETIVPPVYTFIPKHVSGDPDFRGNGPLVSFEWKVRIDSSGKRLLATVSMKARECGGTSTHVFEMPTTVSESREFELYTLPGAGQRIEAIMTPSNFSYRYVDSDTAIDTFSFSSQQPIEKLEFTGDTSGEEAGTKTGVVIYARPIVLNVSSPLVLDPLNVQGDDLYAIYRKGLITRHITKNGRLLEAVALESIDNFRFDMLREDFAHNVYLPITRTDGSVTYGIPLDNIRYSEELAIKHGNTPPHGRERRAWVPIRAPIKNPGVRNDGYYVVSGTGDNPLYYGGMALAGFMLEHHYGVSQYSIQYARKLVEYILASEMTGHNGYLIRRPNYFDSNRSNAGEPIIQGASAEELLGVSLGLMYYLRYEEPSYPLYAKAKALRNRMLTKVSRGDWGWSDYRHPFMLSSHKNPYYSAKAFEYPMYAASGAIASGAARFRYVNLMTLRAGVTGSIGDAFADLNFFDYPMYLTSMILVLDGDIPVSDKRWWAEVFMRDFIKAANSEFFGDFERLQGNAYMGVVGKLVNKYLSNTFNSEDEGRKLRDIWGDDWDTWKSIAASVPVKICASPADRAAAQAAGELVGPSSMFNDEWRITDYSNRLQWQHNLPLWRPTEIGDDPILETLWTERNPNNRIGAWFVWGHKWPFTFSKPARRWYENFPGWAAGTELTEDAYKASNAKKYRRSGYVKVHDDTWIFRTGFLDKEIAGLRGHVDNQVEGAGLGLFFLRMLATHVNSAECPKPILPSVYDRNFKTLPYSGVRPMNPQLMHYKFRTSSESAVGGAYKIAGDKTKSLRVVALGEDLAFQHNFLVGYTDNEERMRLVPGFVSDGFQAGRTIYGPDVYLSTQGVTASRTDKFAMTRTTDPNGNEIVVVAERAEEGGLGIFCRKHWLRVSAWRVSGFAEGNAGHVQRIATWNSSSKNCDAVRDVDIASLGDGAVAVVYISKRKDTKLAVFRVNFTANAIEEIDTATVNGSPEVYYDASVTVAFGNVIVFPSVETDGGQWRYFINSYRWQSGMLHPVSKLEIEELACSRDGSVSAVARLIQSRVFDLVSVKTLDYTKPDYAGAYQIVAAASQALRLAVFSWEVQASGTLVYKGTFWANRDDAEAYLVGSEAAWTTASISAFYGEDRSGFVIAGRGAAREVRDTAGKWQQSAPGLKVVYGHVTDTGLPTIETSNVFGSGDDDDVRMSDMASGLAPGGENPGVLTVHKSKDGYLIAIFWEYRDDFDARRWGQ